MHPGQANSSTHSGLHTAHKCDAPYRGIKSNTSTIMPIWRSSTSSPEGGFDPTYRFATSWILPPALLCFTRALLSLYAFATLFFILGWNGTHGRNADSGRSFSYFTILTYWGLAFYFAFAALHTGSYWLTGRPFLNRWISPLRWAHSAFYSTIVVYPFIVTGM